MRQIGEKHNLNRVIIVSFHSSYSNTTGSTNLITHLQSKHDITISSSKTADKQEELTKNLFPNNSDDLPSKPKSNFLLFRHLTLWFCRDLEPLNKEDNPGFKDFWTYLNNALDLPSRTTVSIGALDDIYLCVKNKLIERLSTSGSHATVTFDAWTDNHKRISYITYTYHFIENWSMRTAVLKTSSFTHPYTSKRIKDDFESTMAEFNVLNKRISVVTDGASTMKKRQNY